ncbi:hypothetical protein K4749_19275 [Streptomyces sp. TRM72054]|uniref:hypothetical protein n=1 Tax=Streptomyces sp. TRM72054 TaxID=2870562 RepID=UPI001C8B2424|nr:hypothetical protein [Streptomyces sp. TRM72054]MBX9395680.1 hypothetical protein [Streptomyces sp. TRM72054]
MSALPPLGLEQMGQDWSEALEMARRIPLRFPDRDRVGVLTDRLRRYVDVLVPGVEGGDRR